MMDIALSRATVALSSNMTLNLSTGPQALNHSGFDLCPTDITLDLFHELCRSKALSNFGNEGIQETREEIDCYLKVHMFTGS